MDGRIPGLNLDGVCGLSWPVAAEYHNLNILGIAPDRFSSLLCPSHTCPTNSTCWVKGKLSSLLPAKTAAAAAAAAAGNGACTTPYKLVQLDHALRSRLICIASVNSDHARQQRTQGSPW